MRCTTFVHCAAWAAVGLLTTQTLLAAPFTYQGLLKDSGGGAATYDFQIDIYSETGDDRVAGPLLFDDVTTDQGRFTLVINPGASIFTGAERWLEIRVRRGSETGPYTTLSPRQRVRPTPYAQHADDADFAAEVAAGSVTGTHINATSVQRRITGVCTGSEVMRSVDQDGGVQCIETGDITEVTAGGGLLGGASTGMAVLSVDTTVVQSVISNSCSEGQAIHGIAQSGATTCVTVPTDYWSRAGNAGTTPGMHFLGTTDAQAFEIRTRGSRHLRIEPSATLSAGAPATANIIAGSSANVVSSGVRGATIAGGGLPFFFNDPDTGSGDPNAVVSHYGTVGGGVDNIAGGNVSFGVGNAYFATVSGGRANAAAGHSSTVSGGSNNFAYGDTSSVSGGTSNTAWVGSSVVAGGSNNCAGAHGSFAAGTNARVRPDSDPGTGGACGGLASYANNGVGDQGTFVWADAAGPAFLSTGSHRFEVRATGGVRFVTGVSVIGVPDAGVKLDADDNAWEVLSDRDAKDGIQAVTSQDVLARLLALPIYTWHYKSQGATTRHIGPMAQDFHAAFGLNGDDNRHISTLDPDGVALAAIQGVYAHFDALRDSDAGRIAALESDNAALRATVNELAKRMHALERGQRD